MVDVARVTMFGMSVGIFRWDSRYDVVQFEYENSFIGRSIEPSPLMMPVREGRVYPSAIWTKRPIGGCLACWPILSLTPMAVRCSSAG